MSEPTAQIERAADLLARSPYTVALTGAGVSVPSGIPDFRSPVSGLWARTDPMAVASLPAFLAAPQRFYAWIRPLAERTAAAKPNAAHEALTRLQSLGRLGPIITQNIDGLHEAAGSRDVLPVHGHTRTGTCTLCSAKIPGEVLWETALGGDVPHCDCGGVVKPDVVLFGELLPLDVLNTAQQAACRASLMLVAGSSLEVSPAAELPLMTYECGGKVLIINLGPTRLDEIAALKLEADVAAVLPALAAGVAARVAQPDAAGDE
ncbi:MAG TPA: RNA polymerase subunit sigma, partial [Chloroflexi bacterium]|nr:RNA polymerase subunit sigma [Chloroflexota bacterium]